MQLRANHSARYFLYNKLSLLILLFCVFSSIGLYFVDVAHATPGNSAFTNTNLYNCILTELDSMNAKKESADGSGFSGRVAIGESYNTTNYELSIITELHCNGYGNASAIRITDSAGFNLMTGLTAFDFVFTDINFYTCVLAELDSKNVKPTSGGSTFNGRIAQGADTYVATDYELGLVGGWLNCSGDGKADNLKIQNTNGIEKLKAITYLWLNSNNLKTPPILTTNTALIYLELGDNDLTAPPILTTNTALKELYLYQNDLTAPPILTTNTALTDLHLDSNALTTPPVLTTNTALSYLYLDNNPLATLDVSSNVALTHLTFDIYLYKYSSKRISDYITFPTTMTFDSPTGSFTYTDGVITNNGNQIGSIYATGSLEAGTLDARLYLFKASLTSSSYSILPNDQNIFIDSIDVADALSKVTATYSQAKIYHDGTYLTTGVISPGDSLRIMNGDEVLHEYDVSNIRLNYGTLTSKIVSAKGLLKQDIGTKPSDWVGKITSTGAGDTPVTIASISKTDSSGDILDNDSIIVTGNKMRITLSDGVTIDYKLAVKGDVTGDGLARTTDVSRLYQHVLGTLTMTGDEYLEAGDVTGDGQLRTTDVSKLYQFVLGTIDVL